MYNITFQQISMFMAVAQRLNISAVASESFITQTALSKMIHRLEDSLGLKLFVRTNRGLTLTPEGEYIYKHLQYSFNSMCKTLQQAQEMGSAQKKQLRIGYPSTFDSSPDYDALKRFIGEYQKKHPEIEFEESLFDFVALKHAVTYAEVDVAFLHSFLLNDTGAEELQSKPVVVGRLFIAVSVNNPLAKLDRLTPELLREEIFYGLPISNEGNAAYSPQYFLEHAGCEPKEFRLVANFPSLLRALSSGKGVAISGYFSDATRDQIKYFPLPVNASPHTLNLTWRKDNHSPLVRDFARSFPDDPKKLTLF